jgi:squalene synthase HpnC
MSTAAFAAELSLYGPQPSAARRAPSLAEAQEYCRRLAKSHYENFTVASFLLPRELRPHFHAVYAYCRWADDLADETAGGAESLRLLDWWQHELDNCYHGDARHPVFVALRQTVDQFSIPIEPFQNLLVAFRQDQYRKRYETFNELLDYCRNSANPVGRLVLYLGRVATPENFQLADSICTGLQLANFWQDVARDCDRGRIYLPLADCRAAGYDEAMFARREFNAGFRYVLAAHVNHADAMLRAGEPLVSRLPHALQLDVALFIRGGLAILDGIRRQDYNVWRRRPVVSKLMKLRLVAAAWRERTRSHALRGNAIRTAPRCEASDVQSLPVTQEFRAAERHRRRSHAERGNEATDLDQSYALCQRFARQAHSNFYYCFYLLPRHKRLSMCALYAFLRRVDDIGDQATGGAPHDRLRRLSALRESLAAALQGRFADPLFAALSDTVMQFGIPAKYLHAVIDGVEMDLIGRGYETFADLAKYCHRVASVVGQACIHIWGFTDERAIELAAQCGLAFQLTNILRDLREDAAIGRVYLPTADLRRFEYTAEELRRGVVDDRFRALLQFEVERAEAYYQKAAELSRYLQADGRRIYSAMFRTYHRLLKKVRSLEGGMRGQRVRLAPWEKLRTAAEALFLPLRLRLPAASTPLSLI